MYESARKVARKIILYIQGLYITSSPITNIKCGSRIGKWALLVAPHQKISRVSDDLESTRTTAIVDGSI